MSVTAAIVQRYDTDVDAEITTLRNNLGEDKLWAEVVPEATSVPYVTCKVLATNATSETKGLGKWVEESFVEFKVRASTQTAVDTLLDQLEDAYIGKSLTVSNRLHKATHPNNRLSPVEERLNLWLGILELRVVLEKQ